MRPIILFWFRRDLRLEDNAGLFHALSNGLPVVPVFIFDRHILDALENRGDRRVAFLFAALDALQKELVTLGSTLDVRYGAPEEVIPELLAEYPVRAVYANEDYEPYATQRDENIRDLLAARQISFHLFKDSVIHARNEVVKPDGTAYSVFTPYARRWRERLTPRHSASFFCRPFFTSFYKQPDRFTLTPASIGFQADVTVFTAPQIPVSILTGYEQTRNLPAVSGTSRLGVHLRFGTLSVRRLVQAALEHSPSFLSELIWREFFQQHLWRQPELVTRSFRPAYEGIRWRNNEAEFQRWTEGRTGYPIVDAGMRELAATGFMHNRVRMITASFLVKHLLVDWRLGEAFFARHLMDFEQASNTGNWQWVAGCGCDAAPYFRIFNPETQQKKFDPDGDYVRRWVPEWETARYPAPLVVHAAARERCLRVYKAAVGGRLELGIGN